MEELRRILEEAGVDATTLAPLAHTNGGDLFGLEGPGGDAAIELWRRLRRLVPTTHHWPVLLGEREEARRLASDLAKAPLDVTKTLAAADALDGAAWLAETLEERAEDLADADAEEADDDVEPNRSFVAPFDLGAGAPHAACSFALVPTERSWEVPAFLGFGGFNECPRSEEHCAILRHWHETHGAEVVAITPDVLETQVARPPKTRTAALALAREQYAYCADIVDQGTASLANLAAGLQGGTTWFFWWD